MNTLRGYPLVSDNEADLPEAINDVARAVDDDVAQRVADLGAHVALVAPHSGHAATNHTHGPNDLTGGFSGQIATETHTFTVQNGLITAVTPV